MENVRKNELIYLYKCVLKELPWDRTGNFAAYLYKIKR